MSRNLILLARYIYNKSQKNRSAAFCKCTQETADECVCGENDSKIFNWTWNHENISEDSNIIVDKQNVIFHPIFSQGTAAIKANKSLDKQMIHYWEIKIISSMTGTDLMVGIETDKVDLLSHQYKYSSLLGLDNQSWGYSYRELAQHNGRLKYYGKRFSSFCIVGVYLDLRRRFIEFYLNRRPQGIAYRQLKIVENAEIYPIVSSTSAKSNIRLINATSFAETLQYLCIKVISKDRKSIEGVQNWVLQFLKAVLTVARVATFEQEPYERDVMMTLMMLKETKPQNTIVMLGLNNQTSAQQVTLAAYEAICFQTRDLLESIAKDLPSWQSLVKLTVGGEFSESPFLLQLLADLCGITIERPQTTSPSCLGAMLASGVTMKLLALDSSRLLFSPPQDVFYPTMCSTQRDLKYRRWKYAITKCLRYNGNFSEVSFEDKDPEMIVRNSIPGGIFLFSSTALFLAKKFFQKT